MSDPVMISRRDLDDYHHRLVLTARIKVAGSKRIARYEHERIDGFDLGWQGHLYPQLADGQDTFLFDLDGHLLVLPIGQRCKVSVAERWDDETQASLARQIADVLEDLDSATDSNNVPLGVEQESRIAWLGSCCSRWIANWPAPTRSPS